MQARVISASAWHITWDNGKVYAVDVNPEMILHLNRRVRDLKAMNVSSILADPDDPLLPERSVDRFFFSNPGITSRTIRSTFRT